MHVQHLHAILTAQRPREQALESELFHDLTGFGVEMTKNLINGTQEVQPGSFIHRCKTLYASEHEPMSWHRMATANWAHIPSVSGMYAR